MTGVQTCALPILRGKTPAAEAKCDTPLDKILLLGRSLGVNATPTLYLANGERISGGLAAADLREMLDQTAAAQPASQPAAKRQR